MQKVISRVLAVVVIVGMASSVLAQQLFVAPGKGQSPQQQQQDEYECYGWAKSQSGVDPMAAPSQPDRGQRAGRTVGGAAKGAALGAAVGAIAGDAGKGAAAGAVVGGVAGRRQGIQNEQRGQATERNSYDRAFAACMEARGYTVR